MPAPQASTRSALRLPAAGARAVRSVREASCGGTACKRCCICISCCQASS
ncbi:hypothetical protein [Delftia lacustris]|nr:hypothetical protein [Delftia lacustris]